jgi:hypothetical protein
MRPPRSGLPRACRPLGGAGGRRWSGSLRRPRFADAMALASGGGRGGEERAARAGRGSGRGLHCSRRVIAAGGHAVRGCVQSRPGPGNFAGGQIRGESRDRVEMSSVWSIHTLLFVFSRLCLLPAVSDPYVERRCQQQHPERRCEPERQV